MLKPALVLAVVMSALPARAQDPPALTGAVNDFAGVIDAGHRDAIARLAYRLQQTTGDVLVVATIKTFEPEADIRSYAVKMFNNGGRGIGTKGKDNGLLVLLAVDDRQMWIEVGYGLEPYITDGFSGETSRQTMAPYFKQGDYGGGLLAGGQRLAARIAEGQGTVLGDDVAPRRTGDRERSGDAGFPIPWPLVIVVLFILVSRMRGGRRRRQTWGNNWSGWSCGGGPFGGGGGGGSSGGFGGGFGGFGGGRSGGGGGGGSW